MCVNNYYVILNALVLLPQRSTTFILIHSFIVVDVCRCDVVSTGNTLPRLAFY